jgi:hypothetical protein
MRKIRYIMMLATTQLVGVIYFNVLKLCSGSIYLAFFIFLLLDGICFYVIEELLSTERIEKYAHFLLEHKNDHASAEFDAALEIAKEFLVTSVTFQVVQFISSICFLGYYYTRFGENVISDGYNILSIIFSHSIVITIRFFKIRNEETSCM